MASNSINFDAYFAKISVDRAALASPNDLQSLSLVQLSHLKAIPFENLDVVSKKVISMDLGVVYEKLVERNRGGYCFEHNTLLEAALQSLGFQVISVLARPRWNRPPTAGYPQTHMVLIVTAADERNYLVDVAFGGLQCLEPLNIDETGESQQTKDGVFRVTQSSDGELTKQWQLKGEWLDLYSFKHASAQPCDLLMSNWWSCTYPEARWMTNLYVAKVISVGPHAENQRHYVLNNEFVMRGSDGTAVRRQLNSLEELFEVLGSVFGIALPEGSVDLVSIERFFKKGSVATFHAPQFISN